jgi:hypothetical protein
MVLTREDITLKKIALEKNQVHMLTKLVTVLRFKSYLSLIVVCSS